MVVGVQLQPSAPAFARAPSTALAGRQGRKRGHAQAGIECGMELGVVTDIQLTN